MPLYAKHRKTILYSIGSVFLIVGAIALVRDTAAVGNDFKVFWRAARAVFEGQSPYRVDVGPGMVFKYPPWILPIFFPFGFFSEKMATWFWGGIQLASLVYVCLELKLRWRVSSVALLVPLVCFWGIWAVHFLDGQINLPMLAVIVFGMRSWERGHLMGLALVFYALTAKVFLVFSFPFWNSDVRLQWKRLTVYAVLLVAGLGLPWIFLTENWNLHRLASEWIVAATSGADGLGVKKIFGRENQGFPAAFVRILEIADSFKGVEIVFALMVYLVLMPSWMILSRELSFRLRTMGAIVVGVVGHPLAWFHLYVYVFPFFVLMMDCAYRSRRQWKMVAAIIPLFLVACVTRKTFFYVGELAEVFSIKAIGALLGLGAALAIKADVLELKKG